MAVLKPSPKPTGDAAALNQFAAAGRAAGATGRVYMGSQRVKTGVDPETKKPTFTTKDVWSTPEAAMAAFYGWGEQGRSNFTAQLVLAGLVPVGSGPLEAEESWRKLVDSAAGYGASGAQVSPYDLLTSYVKAAGGLGKNAWKQQGVFEINTVTGERRYAGPGVYLGDGRAMQMDTRVDLTDPDTARAMATKLFQNMMGRDPGAGELSGFAQALAAAEAASPVTQTTTTQYDMTTGQPISQDTQSSGGVSAEGKAYIGEQQIKGKKEYGVTQAVTTYQNAFEQMVFGSRG
ncbi:hypothetical protein [Streptomyces tsukubensis]|uniref:hypothetical protein n=1 Tax=Streptomyces tsukubensis TaxID=83656 RepID=UPI0034507ED6